MFAEKKSWKRTKLSITANPINSDPQDRQPVSLGSFDLLQPAESLERQLKQPTPLSPHTQSNLLKFHQFFQHFVSRDDFGYLFELYFNQINVIEPHVAPVMVEVGVNEGKYAEVVLKSWPSLFLYVAVDPWKAFDVEDYYDIVNQQHTGDGRVTKVTQEKYDKTYHEALDRLRSFSTISIANNSQINHDKVIILREESQIAATLFSNSSIDVVYIDAMHTYTEVMKDLYAWYRPLKLYGLMAGHDYLLEIHHDSRTVFTVKPAVDDFVQKHNLLLFITNNQNHEHPAYPSWIIVKTHELD
jgi:hypothetical protein